MTRTTRARVRHKVTLRLASRARRESHRLQRTGAATQASRKQSGTPRPRSVPVERTAGPYTVIGQGVGPGDQVVTDGQVRLVSGAPVEVKGMAESPSAPEGDK